jgi:site-specific recombinase XerD
MIADSTVKVDVWQECFQRWLETRRTENTRRSYRCSIEDFRRSTGVELHQATRRDVLAWIESMKERKLTAGTISTRMRAIGSFYNFAIESFLVDGAGLIESSPANVQRLLPKVNRYAHSRALSVGEVQKLLGVILAADSENGLRDYALILGYILLGRRNTEWRLVRICDFEMRDGQVFLHWEGKGSKEVQFVPDDVWKALQEYIQVSGGRGIFDPVFLDRSGMHPISCRRMGQILSRYTRLAGIGKLRVHDLRHTAAMLRREAGADVEEIREFLNHSSLVTTQVYLHKMGRKGDKRTEKVAEMLKNASACR